MKNNLHTVLVVSVVALRFLLGSARLTAQEIDFEYRCVIAGTLSSADQAPAPPESVVDLYVGDTFYVEFWATDSGVANTGIVSAYTDVDYPEDLVTCSSVGHTSLFNFFPDGVCDGFSVDELGGSQLTGGIGAEPEWARVAYVEYTADTAGSAQFMLLPAHAESSAYSRGLIVPSAINFGSCGTVIRERGACCGLDACTDRTTEDQCVGSGGTYLGDGTECSFGSCGCPQVVSTTPPDCSIDARYPHEQNGTALPRLGLDSVQITFDGLIGGVPTASDIDIQTFGGSDGQLQISSITDLGGGTYRVAFDQSVPIQRWTCLRFCGNDNHRMCWGRLPADVNGDGTSSPADILELIDGLNGIGAPQGEWQCDVDFSGVCGAPDILAVIDLLNGAGFVQSWNGETLSVACPSLP